MPLQLDTSAPIQSWYVPEGYEGDPDAPRFLLRPMTQQQVAEVSLAGRADGKAGITFDQLQLTLRYGLADWENVVDHNGKKLKCNTATMQHLPNDLRLELFIEIQNRSELKEDDAKN
jgi:hypothetical protein